jgi:hypothetical protein
MDAVTEWNAGATIKTTPDGMGVVTALVSGAVTLPEWML